MALRKFHDGASTNVSSAAYQPFQKSPAGGMLKVVVDITGTGTLTTETSPDDGTTWISAGADGTFTASGQAAVYVAGGEQVRFTISGASGLTLNCWADSIERSGM